MVRPTNSAAPELCIMARLFSDLVTLDGRLAKTIPDGEIGNKLRALDRAARRGIGSMAAFVQPRLAGSKHHPVLFVLERVERHARSVRAVSQDAHVGGPNALRALLWSMKALLDLDHRLALWAFGVAGNAIADELGEKPPLEALHRALDLIAGVPEQSSAPIVLLGSGADIRESIAASVLEAVLCGPEKRERFMRTALISWENRAAIPWFERRRAGRAARPGEPISLAAARAFARQRVPQEAFCDWMADQVLGSIRDYPAR